MRICTFNGYSTDSRVVDAFLVRDFSSKCCMT
jgi:hypothetical protein